MTQLEYVNRKCKRCGVPIYGRHLCLSCYRNKSGGLHRGAKMPLSALTKNPKRKFSKEDRKWVSVEVEVIENG